MNSSRKSRLPLHDLVIGISISESDDLAEWGYTPADVNRATVRMSEALLTEGAQLIFGHDWRPDGIMDAVCRLAIRYQPSGRGSSDDPLIQSLLAWPNESSMEPTLRTELEQRGVLKIEMLSPPEGEWQSPDAPAAKALALSEMRKELAKRCDARVCLGGRDGSDKNHPVQGFYAGVVEEAYRTLQEEEDKKERPVYFGSFLGGACAKVADFLKKKTSHDSKTPRPGVFSLLTDKKGLLENMQERIKKNAPPTSAQGTEMQGANSTPAQTAARSFTPELAADELPDDLWAAFDNDALQPPSGLELDEWKEMLDAPDTESFITWVIRGLRQVAPGLRSKTADEPTTESATTAGEAGGSTSSATTPNKAETAPNEKETAPNE